MNVPVLTGIDACLLKFTHELHKNKMQSVYFNCKNINKPLHLIFILCTELYNMNWSIEGWRWFFFCMWLTTVFSWFLEGVLKLTNRVPLYLLRNKLCWITELLVWYVFFSSCYQINVYVFWFTWQSGIEILIIVNFTSIGIPEGFSLLSRPLGNKGQDIMLSIFLCWI